jgi:DNA-binding beta-propeller fold protein YncE
MTFSFIKSYLVLVIVIVLVIPSSVFAAVEWSIEKTLKTDAAPIDMTVSPDGRSVFVLTDEGNVLIYDQNGKLKDTIKVGLHVDQIRIGPRGERLFATSQKNRTVEVIVLDFIHKINATGSPVKGPQDAPIVISVFSDFQ